MGRTNASELGTYVARAGGMRLPGEVIDAARLCLSDWVAVAIGARDEDAGRIVRARVAAMGAKGRSTVLYGAPTAPALAALANGTLAHCLDFDDTHISATTHTSAPVWAATLALGEALGAQAPELLRAFVAGFEVAAQLGQGLGAALTARGLHATGVFGRVGAAAAGSVLLGLDPGSAGHALAAAATQASGFTASFGSMAKPYHAGKAAMDGVLGAELARDGFVAAPELLDPGGLDRALVQDGGAVLARADFSRWEILRNSFKPYAACHLTHPAIDAARGLRLDPAVIRAVRTQVSELAQRITGETGGRPRTALAAKFDLRYCTALALAGRPLSARDFEEPWSLDPGIAALASKVETAADPALGYASARLEVEIDDGRTETVAIDTAKGHPGNPMTWDDMRGKFEGLVGPRLGPDRWESLFGCVRGFGAERGVEELRAALAGLG